LKVKCRGKNEETGLFQDLDAFFVQRFFESFFVRFRNARRGEHLDATILVFKRTGKGVKSAVGFLLLTGKRWESESYFVT
jgi:hypothetical protein